MANKKHVKILKKGVKVWNQWRKRNPDVMPELHRAQLLHADLRDADLRDADLRVVDLWGANLWGANLQGADLRGADHCARAARWGHRARRTGKSTRRNIAPIPRP